ncbi:response regulator transcription factor [Paraflavisolibacter sp. H34]|uniref:response regulator transcription factor n=1 Tax=Huijunlia imazamoxiresistens TaxID=3127457 RepID=UPI003016B78D
MEPITILIADDHKLIRETWKLILNTDKRFRVIAECGNGEEAVALSGQLQPRIVLLDINMAPLSGIEATPQVLKKSPSSRVIGLSSFSQPGYAKKMFQMGATGYVTKNSSHEEMVEAILEVSNNKKYVCKEVKDILSEQLSGVEKDGQPDINLLTSREMEVVRYLKQGFSSKEIAGELFVSVKTVEAHRNNILKKLKLKNTAALVNFISTATFEF